MKKLCIFAILMIGSFYAGWNFSRSREMASPDLALPPGRDLLRESLTRVIVVTNFLPTPDSTSQGPFYFDWSKIYSKDFFQYVRNLRDARIPERILRDIVMAEIYRVYAQKWKDLNPIGADWNYWARGDPAIPQRDSSAYQSRLALMKERDEMIRNLFGSSTAFLDQEAVYGYSPSEKIEREIAFLPPEKLSAVREYLQESARAEQGLMGQPLNDESASAIKNLEATRLADLASVLTPDEVEQYELRASPVAHGIRTQLGELELNENEFKQIYRIEKDFFKKMESAPREPLQGQTDEEFVAQKREIVLQREEQLKTILGEDRFRNYTQGGSRLLK